MMNRLALSFSLSLLLNLLLFLWMPELNQAQPKSIIKRYPIQLVSIQVPKPTPPSSKPKPPPKPKPKPRPPQFRPGPKEVEPKPLKVEKPPEPIIEAEPIEVLPVGEEIIPLAAVEWDTKEVVSTDTSAGLPEGEEEGNELAVYEVSSLDNSLEVINYVEPDYPELAAESELAGLVFLRLLVGPKGKVEEVEVLKEDPEGFGFADIARQTVKGWQFSEPRVSGRPVSCYYTLPLRFEP
ncbi:MAG: TonB family protein [bacterium]|nr:TonB family protein [bacterium]